MTEAHILIGNLNFDTQQLWDSELPAASLSWLSNTAFKDFKELLHSAKLLVYFDPDKEIILSCDTSPYGVGAVLLHVDDKKKPTGFASKTLVAAEKGYSQLDKEGLAIVFAVTCFHEYLYGQPFTVVTNHKPLTSLFSETKCIPPLFSATKRR